MLVFIVALVAFATASNASEQKVKDPQGNTIAVILDCCKSGIGASEIYRQVGDASDLALFGATGSGSNELGRVPAGLRAALATDTQ